MQTSSSSLPLTNRHWPQIAPYILAIFWIAGSGLHSVLADRAALDPTRTHQALPLTTPPTIDGKIDTGESDRAGGGAWWAVRPEPLAAVGISAGVMGLGPVPED